MQKLDNEGSLNICVDPHIILGTPLQENNRKTSSLGTVLQAGSKENKSKTRPILNFDTETHAQRFLPLEIRSRSLAATISGVAWRMYALCVRIKPNALGGPCCSKCMLLASMFPSGVCAQKAGRGQKQGPGPRKCTRKDVLQSVLKQTRYYQTCLAVFVYNHPHTIHVGYVYIYIYTYYTPPSETHS